MASEDTSIVIFFDETNQLELVKKLLQDEAAKPKYSSETANAALFSLKESESLNDE